MRLWTSIITAWWWPSHAPCFTSSTEFTTVPRSRSFAEAPLREVSVIAPNSVASRS